MLNFLHVAMMRQAISPRFAMSTRLIRGLPGIFADWRNKERAVLRSDGGYDGHYYDVLRETLCSMSRR